MTAGNLKRTEKTPIKRQSEDKEFGIMSATAKCPHCGAEMDPIEMPLDSTWGGEVHHVCFNDECCYFKKSWTSLENQGIEQTGYRCRMDPRGASGPMAVWSADALKDHICKAG